MKRTKHTKRYLWTAVLLAAAGAAAWALRPRPIPVTTAAVSRGALVATVTGEGRTRVGALFVVSAPVDGQLERVTVHPGDSVDDDGVVAEIRPAISRPLDARTRAEASAAVASAQAAVMRSDAAEREARVASAHADSQLGTTRQLTQKGAVPATDLVHRSHEAELQLRAADGAVAAARMARAELARAKAVLAPTASSAGQTMAVRSPVAGQILRVLRESAGPLAAGTPLLEVGDVKHMEVHADLLSSDATAVRADASATVTGWGGAQPLRARVRRVEPAAFTKVSALGLEEQRVRVVLDLLETPPIGLGHDYRVDAAIVVWESKDAIRVPSTALFRLGDLWALFVVRDGRARRTLVQLGPTDGTWTVATSGVRDADVVIVQRSDAIQDGTRVTERSEDAH